MQGLAAGDDRLVGVDDRDGQLVEALIGVPEGPQIQHAVEQRHQADHAYRNAEGACRTSRLSSPEAMLNERIGSLLEAGGGGGGEIGGVAVGGVRGPIVRIA